MLRALFFGGRMARLRSSPPIAPGCCRLISWGDFKCLGLVLLKRCFEGGTRLSSYLGNVPVRDLFEPGGQTLRSCPSEAAAGAPRAKGRPRAGTAGSRLPAGFVVMDTGHAANP